MKKLMIKSTLHQTVRILQKLTVVMFLLSVTSKLNAQSFAIKAGLNLSNMLMEFEDEPETFDMKLNPGFNVGATVQFPIKGKFHFETGLLLSTKGYRIKERIEIDMNEFAEFKGNANLFYADIPLNAKFLFDVKNVKLYGTLGPYIGIGIIGKTKFEVTYLDEKDSDSDDLEFGSDNADLKRLDYGLSIGCGVEIKSFIVGMSYGHGLANVSTYDDETLKNRVFSTTIGYRLGGK